MKSTILRVLIFSISLLLYSNSGFSQQYPGTNVRGKVLYSDGVPAVNASVDLYYLNYNTNEWVIVASASTDANGFYYFNWISPNSYVIQVNRDVNYDVNIIVIDYQYYSYQDLSILYY